MVSPLTATHPHHSTGPICHPDARTAAANDAASNSHPETRNNFARRVESEDSNTLS